MSGLPQRVPAGVPAGGRFAISSHPEPSFGLGDAGDFDAVEAADTIEASERGGASFVDIPAEEVLAQAKASGTYWGRRYGVDADDVAAESVAAYLRARTSRSRAIAAEPSAYIHRVARNVALMSVVGAERSEERTARSVYLSAIETEVNRLGRQPTGAECDAIAERVRLSQPARRRASRGFHRRRRTVSMTERAWDEPIAESAEERFLADSEVGDDSPGIPEPGSARTGGEMAGLRRRSWSLVAPDAPQVAQRSISEAAARDSRRRVAEGGGLTAVANRWYEGDASAEETSALFAPFGQLDNRQRAAVAKVLLSKPAYAPTMWDLAVMSATARAPRSANRKRPTMARAGVSGRQGSSA